MKDIHDEYWNVIVGRDAYFGIIFWEVDGCYIAYNNVGNYKRSILVWKMHWVICVGYYFRDFWNGFVEDVKWWKDWIDQLVK